MRNKRAPYRYEEDARDRSCKNLYTKPRPSAVVTPDFLHSQQPVHLKTGFAKWVSILVQGQLWHMAENHWQCRQSGMVLCQWSRQTLHSLRSKCVSQVATDFQALTQGLQKPSRGLQGVFSYTMAARQWVESCRQAAEDEQLYCSAIVVGSQRLQARGLLRWRAVHRCRQYSIGAGVLGAFARDSCMLLKAIQLWRYALQHTLKEAYMADEAQRCAQHRGFGGTFAVSTTRVRDRFTVPRLLRICSAILGQHALRLRIAVWSQCKCDHIYRTGIARTVLLHMNELRINMQLRQQAQRWISSVRDACQVAACEFSARLQGYLAEARCRINSPNVVGCADSLAALDQETQSAALSLVQFSRQWAARVIMYYYELLRRHQCLSLSFERLKNRHTDELHQRKNSGKTSSIVSRSCRPQQRLPLRCIVARHSHPSKEAKRSLDLCWGIEKPADTRPRWRAPPAPPDSEQGRQAHHDECTTHAHVFIQEAPIPTVNLLMLDQRLQHQTHTHPLSSARIHKHATTPPQAPGQASAVGALDQFSRQQYMSSNWHGQSA